jgi:hypothetical protein
MWQRLTRFLVLFTSLASVALTTAVLPSREIQARNIPTLEVNTQQAISFFLVLYRSSFRLPDTIDARNPPKRATNKTNHQGLVQGGKISAEGL